MLLRLKTASLGLVTMSLSTALNLNNGWPVTLKPPLLIDTEAGFSLLSSVNKQSRENGQLPHTGSAWHHHLFCQRRTFCRRSNLLARLLITTTILESSRSSMRFLKPWIMLWLSAHTNLEAAATFLREKSNSLSWQIDGELELTCRVVCSFIER